jgi:hypothetical protein
LQGSHAEAHTENKVAQAEKMNLARDLVEATKCNHIVNIIYTIMSNFCSRFFKFFSSGEGRGEWSWESWR